MAYTQPVEKKIFRTEKKFSNAKKNRKKRANLAKNEKKSVCAPTFPKIFPRFSEK